MIQRILPIEECRTILLMDISIPIFFLYLCSKGKEYFDDTRF